MASPSTRRTSWQSRSSGFWSRGEFVSNRRVSPSWSPTGPPPGPPPGPPSTRTASPIQKWGYAVLGGRVVRSGDYHGAWQPAQDDQFQSFAGTPLAPVMYGMAVCGFLPLAIRSPHLPHRHPTQSTMLYCAAVFTLCSASATQVWLDQMKLVFDPTATWDDRMFAVEILVLLSPQLFAPYMWFCAPVFRGILTDFAKYEAQHAWLASEPLAPRWVARRVRLRRIIIGAFFCCTATVLSAITFLKTGLRMRYSYFPAAFASLMMQMFVTLVFSTHHFQLWESARAINAQLQQIATAPTPPDSEASKQAALRAIHTCRRLWVALRALYNGTNYCFMDVFQMLHLFLSLLLGLYMFQAFVFSGVFYNAFVEFMFFLSSLVHLALITNGAHHGIDEMYGPVVDALDQLTMNTDDPQLYRTVTLFYQSVIACPATISLSGFTSVGRPLFTSVISATMTYIVIMLQFQQSEKDVQLNLHTNKTADHVQ